MARRYLRVDEKAREKYMLERGVLGSIAPGGKLLPRALAVRFQAEIVDALAA